MTTWFPSDLEVRLLVTTWFPSDLEVRSYGGQVHVRSRRSYSHAERLSAYRHGARFCGVCGRPSWLDTCSGSCGNCLEWARSITRAAGQTFRSGGRYSPIVSGRSR